MDEGTLNVRVRETGKEGKRREFVGKRNFLFTIRTYFSFNVQSFLHETGVRLVEMRLHFTIYIYIYFHFLERYVCDDVLFYLFYFFK